MFTCILCRFMVELDDVQVHSPWGKCICLGCFDRIMKEA